MKKINKVFTLAACASVFAFSSCIEETLPTSGLTEEQLNSSDKAAEALAWGIPASLNVAGDNGYEWGFGSIMKIRDVLTADAPIASCGYNWYTFWSTNQSMGSRYIMANFTWSFFYRSIMSCNLAINGMKNAETTSGKGFLACGYAYRAMFYLDVARMYEFLPNDIFKTGENADGNNVMYLTVPIFTEETPEEIKYKNPRASHEEMFAFIKSDLEKADSLMKNTNFTPSSKALPGLTAVYGLSARLHLWNAGYMEEAVDTSGVRKYTDEQALEEYKLAQQYAEAAIAVGNNTPLTQSEWLDTKKGFNDLETKSWIWGSYADEEDPTVQTGILNWTSWMSNEAIFGYASAGPYVSIASELYNKMSNTDFRKLSYKAPKKTALRGKEPIIVEDPEKDDYIYESLPDYASFKFRPGGGNTTDYKVAASCSYPLMRIEEMYLIQAEAVAHQKPALGKEMLEAFVQTYRDKNYVCTSSSQEGIIDEIFQQKRIELWGEGRVFFDYKRLNKSVDRTKSDNFDATERFKTDGRPAWMNLVIIISEENGNKAIKGFNNPDYSSCYKAQ